MTCWTTSKIRPFSLHMERKDINKIPCHINNFLYTTVHNSLSHETTSIRGYTLYLSYISSFYKRTLITNKGAIHDFISSTSATVRYFLMVQCFQMQTDKTNETTVIWRYILYAASFERRTLLTTKETILVSM